MNKLIYIIGCFLILSCNCSKKENSIENVSETVSEKTEEITFNKVIQDTVDNENMLIGKINKKGFDQEPFSVWYKSEDSLYTPKTDVIDSIKPLLKNKTIKVFMGTWCEDSQRETPRIYKIMEALDYNTSNFEIIALSRDKDTPNHLEKGFNIEYVPTIIIYENETEKGRIVESSIETLEDDMLSILSGKEYKHTYEE